MIQPTHTSSSSFSPCLPAKPCLCNPQQPPCKSLLLFWLVGSIFPLALRRNVSHKETSPFLRTVSKSMKKAKHEEAICVSILVIWLWSKSWHPALGVCAAQNPFQLKSAQGKRQLPCWLWCLAREQAAHSAPQQTYPLQNTQKDLRKSSGRTSGSPCMSSYNHLWSSLLDGSPLVTFFPLLHFLSSVLCWATH